MTLSLCRTDSTAAKRPSERLDKDSNPVQIVKEAVRLFGSLICCRDIVVQRRIVQCEMNRGVSRLKWLMHASFDTRGELPSGVKNGGINSVLLSCPQSSSAPPAV